MAEKSERVAENRKVIKAFLFDVDVYLISKTVDRSISMSGKFLLDTNIVIALFANEATIKSNLAQASEVFIPSIVIGELYYEAALLHE